MCRKVARANKDIVPSSMTTEATVTGLLLLIPYNSRAMTRVSPNANANPSASPMPCDPQSLQQHIEPQHIDSR